MNGYGARLFEQHQKLLAESAVDPAVAAERGYVSIDTKAQAARFGFSPAQQIVPALGIPLRSVRGDIEGWQLRPDQPRYGRDGKLVKYESPRDQRNLLDVHPRVRGRLGGPGVPLFITEGVRKADAAVSQGLVCIGLMGVYGCRGRNEADGRVALADWESVALNERRVFIVFDSDVMTNPAVYDALARLVRFLRSRNADVAVIYLPAGDGGSKVGLDDYFAGGHTVEELMRLARPDLIRPEVDPIEADDTFDDVPEEDGVLLLGAVAAFIGRYVAFASPAQLVAVVLWVAHTHAIGAFEPTPRLAVLSARRQRQDPAARLLDLLARATRHVFNMSPAYLFRLVEAAQPTLLVDEADTSFGPKNSQANEAVRALITAGHRRGATVSTPSRRHRPSSSHAVPTGRGAMTLSASPATSTTSPPPAVPGSPRQRLIEPTRRRRPPKSTRSSRPRFTRISARVTPSTPRLWATCT